MTFSVSLFCKMCSFAPILILFISHLAKTFGTYPNSCAILYTSVNYIGRNGTIPEGSQFTDLNEEYFTDSISPWNTTGSFRVQNGCRFTGCIERYFKGCQDYNADQPSAVSILSAKCTCQNDCKCSDIRMKRLSCAYAFVDEGGCNLCNPNYLEMSGARPDFPRTMGNNVSAILIQSGCSLTTFAMEDYEGTSTLMQGYSIIQNVSTSIGSYECACDPIIDTWKSPQPSNNSQLINVPSHIDDIVSLIKHHVNHTGFITALQSLKNRRSSHNAYILVLGSTGSGKSSAINVLLNNPNVTAEGNTSSTTSDIHEFRVGIPMDDLLMGNSELRIIDTPGLGDTRGIEYDARFLATLDQYLNTHEDLHMQIPNAVLIFHNFNDNRFSGNHSNFVKMLRGLQSFRNQITDENYSNVIFVLTHFNSANKKARQNPKANIQAFRTAIEEFSLFPKPISIVLAENIGIGNDLLCMDGSFRLPNGDLYPANLIQKMIQATSHGQDPMGGAIFKNAFLNPGTLLYENYNFSSNIFSIIQHRNNFDAKYSKYFNDLSAALLDLENTEVSQHLETAFEHMNESLKETFPNSKVYLQKALKIRNVLNLTDVPKTVLEIVELFSSLQLNDAVVYLLNNGLSLNAPKFSGDLFIGKSYNAFDDAVSSAQLIQQGVSIPTDTGYKFPSTISTVTNRIIQVKDFFRVFKDKEEYANYRRVELGLPNESSVQSFGGIIPPGYNIMPTLATSGADVTLTAVREFRTVQIILNEEYDLSPEFAQACKNLKTCNESNYGNVQDWKLFFQTYGTHMVHSVYGGGSIEIEAVVKRSDVEEATKSIFDLINIADISDRPRLNISNVISHSLKFKGGDPNYHTPNLGVLSIRDAFNLLNNWKKSLHVRPVILTSNLKLMPLSQVAVKIGQNVSSEIQEVTSRFLDSTLKYKPSEWLLNAVKECANDKIKTNANSENHSITIAKEIEEKRAKIKELKSKIDIQNGKFKLDKEKLDGESVRLKTTLESKNVLVAKRQRCITYPS